MKQIALYTTIVLATLMGVAILVQFPEAVFLFLITLTIASASRPIVDSLVKRGVLRGLAVIITYLSILAPLVIFTIILSGSLLNELKQLSDSLAISYEHIYSTWPKGTSIQQTIISQLPPPEQLYTAVTGEKGGALAQTLLGITSSSVSWLSQFFAVLVLSIYWTIDRIHFERLWLSLLPVEIRAHWREIGREIENELGAYIRSELLQSLISGILLGIGFYLIGLPYPVLLAVFGALAWLVPWVGALLAIIPILFVGLTTGLPLMLAAVMYTLFVLGAMELYIEPRIFHHRKYSPWLTLLLIMALGDAMGLIGLLLAPPIAAIIQMIGRRIQQDPSPLLAPPTEIESARAIALLDDRVGSVRDMIHKMEEKPSIQTENMLERLDSLVQKANEIIAAQADKNP
jgi:putative permease